MSTSLTKVGSAFALALFIAVGSPEAHAADVVDTAASVDELSTLVQLVTDAGLVQTLKDAEDITVFAPTNAAFDKLPKALLRAIETDPAILTAILTYHVSGERLDSSEVVALRTISTLEGSKIHVRSAGGKVFLNTSRVTTVDIETDNATVHLIDRVLIPWKSILPKVVQALSHS